MAEINICPVCGVSVEVHQRVEGGNLTYWLEAQVPRWISVEERLPEDDEMYLVYTTEHTCAVYRYWGDGEWETEWGEDASHDITHWMPLPEPPKEE